MFSPFVDPPWGVCVPTGSLAVWSILQQLSPIISKPSQSPQIFSPNFHTIFKGTGKLCHSLIPLEGVWKTWGVLGCLYSHAHRDGSFWSLLLPGFPQKLSKSTPYSQRHMCFWSCHQDGVSSRAGAQRSLLLGHNNSLLCQISNFFLCASENIFWLGLDSVNFSKMPCLSFRLKNQEENGVLIVWFCYENFSKAMDTSSLTVQTECKFWRWAK